MVRALVLRGIGAGALGGLIAFVFARIFAEPLIQAAIDYESGRDEAKDALAVAAGQQPEAAGPDIFSRAIQANVGIGVGMIAFGVAVGCFFAVAFCMAYGRTGRIRPRQLSLLVALAGFVTLYFVPFLKYPANPPSIGNPDTIGDRAGLYGVMIIAAVVFAILAVWVGQRLQARLGTWNSTLVATLLFAVLCGVVMALLPALGSLSANADLTGSLLTETPQPLKDAAGTIVYPGFDADLLFRFRLYSLIAQILLWGVMGLTFAPLADKVFARDGDREFAAV
ncbi:MAG: cobalt transporter [Pseudonocardia sp. SCN 72-86]|nr:MAG: cobalt transporter [Pseudonocardia sp. SCN 72-86]